MLFLCQWKDCWVGWSRAGYVKAKDIDEARKIICDHLVNGCELIQIKPANESWITPQSLTINFPNLTDYELFG